MNDNTYLDSTQCNNNYPPLCGDDYKVKWLTTYVCVQQVTLGKVKPLILYRSAQTCNARTSTGKTNKKTHRWKHFNASLPDVLEACQRVHDVPDHRCAPISLRLLVHLNKLPRLLVHLHRQILLRVWNLLHSSLQVDEALRSCRWFREFVRHRHLQLILTEVPSARLFSTWGASSHQWKKPANIYKC